MRQREILLKQQLNLIRVMLLAIGVYQLLMHIMVILGKQKKNGLKTLELSPVDPEIPNFLIKVSSKLVGTQKIKTFNE